MPPTFIVPPVQHARHRNRIDLERERTSSGSSAAARSRISSGTTHSRDDISTSEESWSEYDYDDDEEESDGIDPSDSASRLPPRSARPVAPPPPTARRHIPIVSAPHEEEDDDEEPPPPRRHRQPPRRHDDRPARSTERRVASDESSGTVASSHDDYPHGHYGMPRHAPAPPAGFHGLPRTHSGYPPSLTSAGGFSEPYDARQALVQMQRDPFAHPQPNPFATHPAQPNPFQPISPTENTNYFAGDPHSPPIPHQRPPAPQRPQSFAGPQVYGGEMVAPYHAQTLPAHPMGGYPTPWAGYPPFPYQWMQHPQGKQTEKPGRSRSPSSKKSTPPPPVSAGPLVLPKDLEMKNHEIDALKNRLQQQLQVNMRREQMDRQKEAEALAQKAEAAQAKRDAEQRAIREAELDALKSLIKKHEEDRDAREAAWRKEREAEAAAKAAAIAKAEEEKKRKEEIDAASAKAKDEAEKIAADAAKKADEEYKTKLAEAEKAKEESEKKKKALEEEIEKSKPPSDMTKLPIRFKDAVGRKFSFPWHLCKTWKGMEDLIKQAFAHVDTIGEHVHEGHYDLTGPNGEIILPKVWDSMVQPDWEITMHLWPFEEQTAPEPPPKPSDNIWEHLGMLGGGPGGLAFPPPAAGAAAGTAKKKSGKKASSSGKKKAHPPAGPDPMAAAAAIGLPPLNPVADAGPIPPPPPLGAMGPPGFENDLFHGIGAFPGGIPGPPPEKKKKSSSSSKKKGKEMSALGMWLTGSAPKSKKK